MIYLLCCDGLERKMLYCDGFRMSVYQNFWVKIRFSSLLSRPQVPGEMEYEYLSGVSDILILSQSFLLYLGGSIFKSGLHLHSHVQCLNCLQMYFLIDNTVPNASCNGTSCMWIFMQGINLLLFGQFCICYRFSCCCLVEECKC